MNSNNLTEYVQAVMELEKHKYTLESINNQLNKEINSDTPCSANQPIEPSKPVLNQKRGKIHGFVIGILVLLIFPCLSVVFYMGSLYIIILGGKYRFLGLFLAVVGLFGIISAIVYIIHKNYLEKKSAKQQYLNDMAEYNQNMEKFKQEQQQYNSVLLQFNQQQSEKKLILQKKQNEIKDVYQETCALLQKYYALNIVPETYRELIPICMFYEYLADKRTYTLNSDGYDPGTINMYEDEKSKRIIITNLNSILENLSAIQNHQSKLYDVIQDSNSETIRVMNSIKSGIDQNNSNSDNTSQTLELNHYLSEINHANTVYQNRLLEKQYSGL